MKVTCKTVTGASFDVAAEPSTSVSAVRSLIEAAKPEISGDTLIIIHQGKILKDEDTLSGIGFGDASFLVLMTKPAAKKKEEPKPAAEAPAAGSCEPSSAAAGATEPAAAPEGGAAAPAAAAPEAAAAPPAETADAYTNTASQLMTGDALEQSINMICEMGFERADVQRVMRAAFNNPERAVEYLMSGVPPEAAADAPAPAAAGAAAAPATAAGAPAAAAPAPAGPNAQPLDLFAPPGAAAAAQAGGAGGAGGGGPLDFLRANPQFNALRSIVQANPQVLEPMLAELGRAQPDLLALINANQGDFLRLVNEPVAGGGGAAGGALAELAASLEGAGGGAPGGLSPGAVAVNLTPEEIEAVGRLEALGFERGAAVEAFLACDKNEALAANYLFENPDDDEEEGQGAAGGGGGGARSA